MMISHHFACPVMAELSFALSLANGLKCRADFSQNSYLSPHARKVQIAPVLILKNSPCYLSQGPFLRAMKSKWVFPFSYISRRVREKICGKIVGISKLLGNQHSETNRKSSPS